MMEEYIRKKDITSVFYNEPPDVHYASYYLDKIQRLPTTPLEINGDPAINYKPKARTDVVHEAMADALKAVTNSELSSSDNLLGLIAQGVMELSVSVAMLVDIAESRER